MKLIKEYTDSLEILEEGKDSGQLFFRGITLQGNIKNKNGRVYPKEVLQNAIREHTDSFLKNGRSLGELNHPDTNTARIDLTKVSHKFVEIKEDGDNFITKAKILVETPNGKIVKNLLENEVTMGISSRGLGNIKESDEGNIVQKFYIVTPGDIVADPSAPDAFIQGVMEGKEWVYENGVLVGKDISKEIDKYQEMIKTSKKSDVQKAIKEIFTDYFTKLLK